MTRGQLRFLTYLLTAGLFLGLNLAAIGQDESIPVDTLGSISEVDSSSTDSLKGIRHFFQSDYPNPKKALLFSLVLPGAGQAYNKGWWKIPIVYGALGGMAYLVDLNATEYLSYKRAYRRQVRGLPHDFTGTRIASASTLQELRNRSNQNMQRAYFGLFAVYGLAAMEAFVDAHLDSFEVSDDLSFHLQPSLEPTPLGFGSMGVSVSLHFQ
jgi:hypothetical protein